MIFTKSRLNVKIAHTGNGQFFPGFVIVTRDMKIMKYLKTLIKQEIGTSILLIYLNFTIGTIISLSANIIIKLIEIM